MHRLDFKAGEISGVERQDLTDAADVHGGNKAGIVHFRTEQLASSYQAGYAFDVYGMAWVVRLGPAQQHVGIDENTHPRAS
jgi:hypothetical protein